MKIQLNCMKNIKSFTIPNSQEFHNLLTTIVEKVSSTIGICLDTNCVISYSYLILI